MKSLTANSKLRLAVTSSVVVCVLALAGFGVAPLYADNSGPTSTTSITKHQATNAQLEKAYQGELKELGVQQTHLNEANTLAAAVQSQIDKLNTAGRDTSSLATALSTFQSQIATAQSAYDAAGSILDAHAGFDANGHVTDPVLARQTATDAHQSLLNAHNVLKQAVEDLHQFIVGFRKAHQLVSDSAKVIAHASHRPGK
jgi:hypothetical protein